MFAVTANMKEMYYVCTMKQAIYLFQHWLDSYTMMLGYYYYNSYLFS